MGGFAGGATGCVPRSAAWMESAALRPCPIEMVARPRPTESPPDQTASSPVRPQASTSSHDPFTSTAPSVDQSGSWLTAVTSVSAGIS
jgi:hypothetical protein